MLSVKTFAAIYSTKNNNYELDNIAIVDYFVEEDIFIVKSGKYYGSTSYDYNRIRCEHDTIFEIPQEVEIEDEIDNLKSIYIFNSSFYQEELKKNRFMVSATLDSLVSKLLPIKLHKNMDGTIYTKYEETDTLFDYDGLKTIPEEQDTEEELSDSSKEDLKKSFDNLMNNLLAISLVNVVQDLVNNEETNKNPEVDKEKNNGVKTQRLLTEPFLYQETRKDRLEELKKRLEEKKKEDTSKKIIKVNEMIEEISSKIVGQRKAIETLVSNIYYNQVLIDHLLKDGEYDPSRLDSSKVAILLDGSTGTGKTAIEKEIARMLDLPIVITNANSFSETGYVGPTITDILSKLLDQANGNLEKAERGIIVLDEIDKVASKDYVYVKDMDRGVQEELLSFIGGGEYDLKENALFSKSKIFDTSKITFILSGAFTDLREEKIKEVEKKNKPMGFNSSTSNLNTYEITPEDYIKYGLMREFFGRIKVLTSTKSYKLEDLKTILLTSVISPLKNFENSVKMFGYSGIDYNDEFVTEVAEEALKMSTGARSLQTIMSGIQSNMLMSLINQEYDINKPIKLEKKLIKEYKNNNIREF